MSPSSAVDLIATIDVPQGHLQEVVRMLEEYGQEVRAEPGNRRFEVYTSQAGGRSVVVLERYASQAAFATHLADPANARFNDALGYLLGGVESSLEFLRPGPPPAVTAGGA